MVEEGWINELLRVVKNTSYLTLPRLTQEFKAQAKWLKSLRHSACAEGALTQIEVTDLDTWHSFALTPPPPVEAASSSDPSSRN